MGSFCSAWVGQASTLWGNTQKGIYTWGQIGYDEENGPFRDPRFKPKGAAGRQVRVVGICISSFSGAAPNHPLHATAWTWDF
jgi:hypothetical protein